MKGEPVGELELLTPGECIACGDLMGDQVWAPRGGSVTISACVGMIGWGERELLSLVLFFFAQFVRGTQ